MVVVSPACKLVPDWEGLRTTWVWEITWPLPSGCELRKAVTSHKFVPLTLPPLDDEVNVRSKVTALPPLRSLSGEAAEVTRVELLVTWTPEEEMILFYYRYSSGINFRTTLVSFHIWSSLFPLSWILPVNQTCITYAKLFAMSRKYPFHRTINKLSKTNFWFLIVHRMLETTFFHSWKKKYGLSPQYVNRKEFSIRQLHTCVWIWCKADSCLFAFFPYLPLHSTGTHRTVCPVSTKSGLGLLPFCSSTQIYGNWLQVKPVKSKSALRLFSIAVPPAGKGVPSCPTWLKLIVLWIMDVPLPSALELENTISFHRPVPVMLEPLGSLLKLMSKVKGLDDFPSPR